MEFKLDIPSDVLSVMEALHQDGKQVYVVGGCLRDALLGRTPHDFDLCTNSDPKNTVSVLNKYLHNPTYNFQGMHHATIKVSVDGGEFIDITMFGQNPNFVDSDINDWYGLHIEDDLHRRDFTMNAMAYTPFPEPTLIDLFYGVEDIRDGKLRFVNLPANAIRKDPFLILRAFRQAIQLEFTFDRYLAYILCDEQLLKMMYVHVSGWRKGNELRKILSVNFTDSKPLTVNYYILFLNVVVPYIFNETINERIEESEYELFTSPADWRDRLVLLLQRFDIPNVNKLLMTFDYDFDDIQYILKALEGITG